MKEKQFLLVKRGLYYRPDNQGYTGIKDYAGRYMASDCSPDDNVIAIHEDDAPDYSEACYHDLMAEHARAKVLVLSKALSWYADQMCEGWCEGKTPAACASIGSENCAGCHAVIAIAESCDPVALGRIK